MKRLTTLIFVVAALALLLPARSASASLIVFSQATDLGGGSWRYDYTLLPDPSSPLEANQDIVIYFARDDYDSLEDLTPPLAPDWMTFVFQPDQLFHGADGEFDALTLAGNPTIPLAFSVKFAWLGGPGMTPGAQPFDVLQFDAAGNYLGVLDRGMTTAVPEPGTLILLGLGLAGLVRSLSKR